ncbi:hypothetical protein WG66_008482, partial [Moniliophthora roreri]
MQRNLVVASRPFIQSNSSPFFNSEQLHHYHHTIQDSRIRNLSWLPPPVSSSLTETLCSHTMSPFFSLFGNLPSVWRFHTARNSSMLHPKRHLYPLNSTVISTLPIYFTCHI